jgi:putative DNA primase/helicase
VKARLVDGSVVDAVSVHFEAQEPDAHADDLVEIIRLSDVPPEAIDWLWAGRLARRKQTLLAGDPGTGKSLLTIDIAARITTGAVWPDGGRAALGNVLFLCAEDGVADGVRPRIDAAHGDPARVFVVKGVPDALNTRTLDLARDLASLERAIELTQPALVVIDPISAYLGRTDSYKDAEVRGLLAPLLAVVERHGCALLTVAHLAKDQQRAALHRPGGSVAFVAAARLVFALATDPNDSDRRIVASLKANICRPASALAFRLPDARVEWDAGPVDMTADALLRPAPTHEDREERVTAETFLREILSDGETKANDVQRAAESNGVSRRQLWAAKARLKVKAKRIGAPGGGGYWMWRLAEATVSAGSSLSTLDTDDLLDTEDTNHIKSNNSINRKGEDRRDACLAVEPAITSTFTETELVAAGLPAPNGRVS